MFRTSLLWLSEQPRIFRFIRRNGLARRFAARFVAGETVDSGVAAVKELNAAGLVASLDLLGESVHSAAEALRARDTYLEPDTVAFPDKRDVDANYVRCMERLMLKGHYPGIATHDVRIIDHALAFARDKGIQPHRFEFQMLYGVRRDLQVRLRRKGYNV